MLRLSLKLLLGALGLALLPLEAMADPGLPASTSDPAAGWPIFLQSLGIIFREGLEALLLCTALAAATVRAGFTRGPRAIWRGAALAIAASLVSAWLVARVLDIAPAGREAIEGITMLLAAAVLFYVSYWLLSKLEVRRWMGYLERRIGRADSVAAITAVAFLAVYREGVETILFYEALAGIGRPLPIWSGLAAGVLALGGVGVGVFRFGLRLPLRPLFAVTGGLLYLLAFVFAGQGIHELQEAGWVTESQLDGWPRLVALGLHPTLETVVVQAVLVVLAVGAAVTLVVRARRTALVSEPAAGAPGEPVEVS